MTKTYYSLTPINKEDLYPNQPYVVVVQTENPGAAVGIVHSDKPNWMSSTADGTVGVFNLETLVKA